MDLPTIFQDVAKTWDWILQPVHFGAIVMPTILVSGATVTRWALSLPFTSWADALLAFVAFDATVIIDSDSFRFIFSSADVAKHSIGIHLVLLLVAAISWVILIWRAEKVLSPSTSRRTYSKFLVSAIGILIVAAIITIHVFTYLA